MNDLNDYQNETDDLDVKRKLSPGFFGLLILVLWLMAIIWEDSVDYFRRLLGYPERNYLDL